MERRPLSVRLDSTTWKNLETEATSKGLTVSELARQKLAQSVEYDPHLTEFITDITNRLHLSMTDFMECLLYDFMARVDAELEVYGGSMWSFIPFFKTPEGDILHGDELYKDLKDTHVDMYTRERKKRLLEREAVGEALSPESRRFLIANRAGQTWINSEEYKDEKTLFQKYKKLGQEAKQKGLVPEALNLPDIQVGKVYERVLAGNMSEHDFLEEITNPYYMYYYDETKNSKAEFDDGKTD